MEKIPGKSSIESLPEHEQNKINEIKKLIEEIADIDFLEYNDLMKEFKKLRKTYDDTDTYNELYKYKIWHSVIASTVVPDKMPYMDLPGNTIENMVREKYRKVTNK
jgi:hypothetical protein